MFGGLWLQKNLPLCFLNHRDKATSLIGALWVILFGWVLVVFSFSSS